VISKVLNKNILNRYSFLEPIVKLGQNSLPVFSLSLIICYLASSILVISGGSRPFYMAVIMSEIVILFTLGFYLAKSKRFEKLLSLKWVEAPKIQTASLSMLKPKNSTRLLK
jgi:hypothetical protein